MTQDERRMLSELADKVAKTPAPPKDPEAEEFIRTNIGKRPDALYLMTQTVLIQNMALDQAQRQLRDLQARSGQAASAGGGGSFLGGGQNTQSGQQQYGQQPQYAQAMPNAGGGAPSFLRGAAQTAAGVAAGALAFEGIRSLFSHPGYGGDPGFGDYGGFGGDYGGDTVVNNYYEGGGPDQYASTGDDLSLNDNRDSFGGNDYNDVSDSSDFGGFDDGGSDDNFA